MVSFLHDLLLTDVWHLLLFLDKQETHDTGKHIRDVILYHPLLLHLLFLLLLSSFFLLFDPTTTITFFLAFFAVFSVTFVVTFWCVILLLNIILSL